MPRNNPARLIAQWLNRRVKRYAFPAVKLTINPAHRWAPLDLKPEQPPHRSLAITSSMISLVPA